LLTADSLFSGKLIVYQEKEGYRFSLDAVLLAGFSKVKPADRIIDLGTGCGVVPLILAYRKLGQSLVGVEVQSELAALAQKNVETNGFSDRIRIYEMDYRQVASQFPAGGFDLAVSNPPYRRIDTGRINPHRQKALARHELAGSISDVFSAAKQLLPRGGRLAVIYPATRLDHLVVTAHRSGFSPKELTVVHSDRSGPGRLVFLECRKGGGEELKVTPPFFIYEADGTYTEAMRVFFED
jgi:tRNA1Val (adenine37-N6)-methyltransferase